MYITFFTILQPYPEPLLHIGITQSLQPLNLANLVPQALAAALYVACGTRGCGQPLQQCSLRLVLGRVLIINLARLGDYGAVSRGVEHEND